jgi:hypothetical protein
MAVTYDAIETYNLSGVSTVTFSAIPQTYSDLVIHYNAKSSLGQINLGFRLNNDTSANYYWGLFESVNGSTGGSNNAGQNYGFVGYLPAIRAGGGTININNYVDSSYKTQVQSLNVGNSTAINNVIQWDNNSAITSVTFFNTAGYNFASPSVVTLYGILRA